MTHFHSVIVLGNCLYGFSLHCQSMPDIKVPRIDVNTSSGNEYRCTLSFDICSTVIIINKFISFL